MALLLATQPAKEDIPPHPAPVQDTIVWFFGDVGSATESSPDTKVMSVIRTVVNQSVAKAWQSSTFQTAMEKEVQKYLVEPHVVNDVATHTIDAPALVVPVAKFMKNEIEIRSLENAKMDQHRNISNKAGVHRKKMTEDKFSPQKKDSIRSLRPSKDKSDDKKTNLKAYSSFTSSAESATRRYQNRRREEWRIRYRSVLAHMRDHSESNLKVLEPVNKTNQTAVDYRSYHLI